MSYYDNNLKWIEKYHPYLYEKIEDRNEDILEETIKVWSESAKQEGKVLFVEKDKKNVRLNSLYNPREEASIWSDQYEFKDVNSYCVMFGFGNGTFVQELQNRMREDTILIVLEPSASIFTHVIENYDMTNILTRKNTIIAVEGINDNDLQNALPLAFNSLNLRTGKHTFHPKYDQIYPYSYLEFLKKVEKAQIMVVCNINTGLILGVNLISGLLMNLKKLMISNTIYDYKDLFSPNMPVIIVAAGPSVRKNINELKKAKGKALIIAVDRILGFLLENGIRPDLVATLDPVKPFELLSTKEEQDIPLLTSLEATPESVNLFTGKQIFVMTSRYVVDIFHSIKSDYAYINVGGSVATMAFSVCLYWGIKNIILVGQDLSYGDKHETHAGSIQDGYGNNDNVMLDGIYGGKVESRKDWAVFLNWYESVLKVNEDTNLIDATQGGALIQGSIVMDLKDAIEKYAVEEMDYEKIIQNTKPTLDHFKREKMLSCLEKDYKDLARIRKKAKTGIGICKQLIKGSIPSTKENANKLWKINDFISTKRVNTLLDQGVDALAEPKLLELYKFSHNKKEDTKKTFDQAKIVYEATCDSIDFTDKYMKDAIREIKQMVEEEKVEDISEKK